MIVTSLILKNMVFEYVRFVALAVGLLSSVTTTVNAVPSLEPRQIPANATDVTTIKSPTGVTIRYKGLYFPGPLYLCSSEAGASKYCLMTPVLPLKA